MQSTTDADRDDDNDVDNDDGNGDYDYGAPQNRSVTMHKMLGACCGMWHIINTVRYIGGKTRCFLALLQKSVISA